MVNTSLDQVPSTQAKSLLGRLSDFVFGYDFFVSYCWADGRNYAVRLVQQLQEQGFECFLDSSDYAKGDNWRDQGRRALKKTSRLILVGTPKALASEPVKNELDIFSRLGRRILPIDFEDSLAGIPQDSPIARHLTADTLFITEPLRALDSGPSPATINAIRGTFNLLRQQQKRMRLFASAAVAFAAISMIAIALFYLASNRQAESMALAWTAQGETIFEANPVEGLHLARQGWNTLPSGSNSLSKRLIDRVLRLASNGRLARVGTDVLAAELTDDGKLFIARRHADGEVRDAADLRLIQPLNKPARQISLDSSSRYLILEHQSPNTDANFSIHRRKDGEFLGYRNRIADSPPPIFPANDARYIYSDIGSSPTIQRLTDRSQIGRDDFDIMRFLYEKGWPVFALSYRDYSNTRQPPNAELFDIYSGAVIHQFSSRDVEFSKSRSGAYSIIRFTRSGDEFAQATIYSTGSAYVVSSAAETSLWISGRDLKLSDVPTQISVAEIDGRRYVLLGYDDRSEIWSLADRKLVAELPAFDAATLIPNLSGWVLTPAQPASESQFIKVVEGRIVSEPIKVRFSRVDLPADAQGRYFIADTEENGRELRHQRDGIPLPLPDPVKEFTFSRDPSTPIFGVHYRGSKSSEIRRIADGSLVHAIDHDGEVEIEFETGEFFILNYLELDDRHKLSHAELRRNIDGALIATEHDEIRGYSSNSSGDLLILETEDKNVEERDRDERSKTVFLRSEDGFRRLEKSRDELSRRVVFHPDAANLVFVGSEAQNRTAHLYAVELDATAPGTQSVRRIGSSEAPAKIIEYFSSGRIDYLLMGTKGDRLELWNMGKQPRRIFRSQVGLTGFIRLPGEGRLLIWYDDGRSYVLDTGLINFATAATESEDSADTDRFLKYIQEKLFNDRWLNPTIIEEQQALLRLD